MKIRTVIFALLVFAVAPGWANAADTDEESAAVQTAVAEQDATPAQDTETAQDLKKKQDRRGKEAKTAEAAKEDDWDPDEVTCKRFAETGSRIKKRYCATNRDWKKIAESGENAVDWMKRQGAIGN